MFPESGRSLGVGHGNPLQYSVLGEFRLRSIEKWKREESRPAPRGSLEAIQNFASRGHCMEAGDGIGQPVHSPQPLQAPGSWA